MCTLVVQHFITLALQVPIIKFQDSKTHCAIDISLAAGNGPENTAVVMDFLKRMPAAKPVILVCLQ
jgi:DNA polymerase sigma